MTQFNDVQDWRDFLEQRNEHKRAKDQPSILLTGMRQETGSWGQVFLANGLAVVGWCKFIMVHSSWAINVFEPTGFVPDTGMPPFRERIIPADGVFMLEALTPEMVLETFIKGLGKATDEADLKRKAATSLRMLKEWVETGEFEEVKSSPINLFTGPVPIGHG